MWMVYVGEVFAYCLSFETSPPDQTSEGMGLEEGEPCA